MASSFRQQPEREGQCGQDRWQLVWLTQRKQNDAVICPLPPSYPRRSICSHWRHAYAQSIFADVFYYSCCWSMLICESDVWLALLQTLSLWPVFVWLCNPLIVHTRAHVNGRNEQRHVIRISVRNKCFLTCWSLSLSVLIFLSGEKNNGVSSRRITAMKRVRISYTRRVINNSDQSKCTMHVGSLFGAITINLSVISVQRSNERLFPFSPWYFGNRHHSSASFLWHGKIEFSLLSVDRRRRKRSN